MGSALSSALSGLRVHQSYLDVIGNNLANSNTPGFRGSSVNFSDLLSQLVRSGTSPVGSVGGTNPIQVGLGVQVHSIGLKSGQGVLDDTGNPFDLGVQGDGFFILSSGGSNVYTRAGMFGLDENNFLVDRSTGFRAQSVTGADIQVPLNSLLPAQSTSEIEIGGNLPAQIGGPIQEVLTTSAAFQEGTSAVVTGITEPPAGFAINIGDEMTIGVDGGAAQSLVFDGTFITSGAATAVEVANAITAQISGVTASGASGQVVITSTRTGLASTIKITESGTPGSPATVLGMTTNLVQGSESAASASTFLNDLSDNIVDYLAGDTIELTGTSAGGTPFSGTFMFGAANDGDTVGDLVTFIDNLLPDATASLDASGNIVVTADNQGEASLALTLVDTSVNGSTVFASHGFQVTTEGTGPDEARTSIDVFDPAGLRHSLTFTFTRVSNRQWDLTATSDNANDLVVNGTVTGIQFNEDGSLAVAGTGPNGTTIDIQFEGAAAAQSIDVNLGQIFDGLTQLGDNNSVRALFQDGYPAGDLESVSVRGDGFLEGFYTNGQNQELQQLALAVFSNPGGLLKVGDSMFAESANSGLPQIQIAGSGRAGTISSGVLESSNVDVAEEFVRLIEAQRGFQANARVIRVADELLVELVNLV